MSLLAEMLRYTSQRCFFVIRANFRQIYHFQAAPHNLFFSTCDLEVVEFPIIYRCFTGVLSMHLVDNCAIKLIFQDKPYWACLFNNPKVGFQSTLSLLPFFRTLYRTESPTSNARNFEFRSAYFACRFLACFRR